MGQFRVLTLGINQPPCLIIIHSARLEEEPILSRLPPINPKDEERRLPVSLLY